MDRRNPDEDLGYDLSLICAADMGAAAPGGEQGIVLHVRHDCEKCRRGCRRASPARHDATYPNLHLSDDSTRRVHRTELEKVNFPIGNPDDLDALVLA